MGKKITTLCFGMLTAGTIAAVSYGITKEQLMVPNNSGRGNIATTSMTTIGSNKSIPMRVPDGGYTAPVHFAPTQEQFNECTIIDVNEDGKKWTYDGGWFKYPYNTQLAADDWCMLPTMKLEAGTYKVSFTYKVRSSSNPENFKMCFGSSQQPGDMKIVVLEKQDYTTTSEVTESRTVEIPNAGEWYIGLYAFSAANKFGIYFKDIKVEKLDLNQPKSPTLSAQTDGLNCTLKVKLPSETIGGTALNVTTVSADVFLDDNAIEGGTVTGAPGEEKTVNFTATSGTHSISAIATVSNNGTELKSEPGIIDVKFSKKQPIPTPMGYTFEPDIDEFGWCTVIDSNEDNSTWSYSDSGYPTGGVVGKGAFRYSYSWTRPGDDWIILPAFDGTEAGARMLTFATATKYNDEGLEVCMAYEPTVDALSKNVLWKKDHFQSSEGFTNEEVIFSVEGGRNFYIAFHAISPKSAAYLYVQNIKVDITDGTGPVAGVLSDVEFDGGNGTIKLTLPQKNLNGQNLDASTVVYADITLDGNPYGEPVHGTPGEVKVLNFSDLALGNHSVTATTYTLDADNNRKGNQKTSIDFKCRISSSFAYQLPLSLDLNQSVYDNFLIVDANNDEKMWTGEADCFELSYHPSNSGDDWFITPAIDFNDITSRFEIALTALSNSSYAEAFEVFIGREQSVEAMTTPLITRTEVKTDEPRRYESTFNLTEPGRYYIGVHGVSDPNKLRLKMTKLEVFKSNQSNNAPGAVTELTANGFETGELKANVSFTFPTKTIGGETIDANTTLTANIISTTETKTVEGKPGSQANVVIACPEGNSVITVYVTSESGEGIRTNAEVNCGLDRPSTPVITNCTVSEDNNSLKLEWEAITTGASGGHANPDGMDYYIFEWDEVDQDWYQVGVTENLSYTYNYDGSGLAMVTLGLQAYNGLNSGSTMVPVSVVLGQPYQLAKNGNFLTMNENFEQGTLHYEPLTLSSSLGSEYAPEWKIVNPSTVISGVVSQNGGYSLYGHTSWNRGDSYIGIPKFSTEGILDAEVKLTVYQHPASCEYKLMALGYGIDEPVVFGEIPIPQTTEGWKSFTFKLPEQFIGRKWVDVRLHVNFNGGSSCIPLIDAYVVRPGNKTTGVNSLMEGLSGTVSGSKGAIIFTGFDGATARVYSAAGQQIAVETINIAGQTVKVPAGIYIVTIDGKTFKVVVN